MTAKLIWFLILVSYGYLIGTNPWSKVQAQRIWKYILTKSRGLARALNDRRKKMDVRFLGRILLATVAYLIVVISFYWTVHKELELFAINPAKIKTWNDLRTFGLGLSGFIAVWLAIVGAILSAARTKAMEDANRQHVDDHRQRLYMDALGTLNRVQDYQKAGAIESLRKLGTQEDGEYSTQAIEILTAFIRSTARIADKKTKQRLNPEGTALNIASALYALSDLLNQPTSFTMTVGHQSLDFKNLDLSELSFTKSNDLSNLNFLECKFFKSQFIDQKMSSISFVECDFTDASFRGTHFNGGSSSLVCFAFSKFGGTVISDTDFAGVSDFDEFDLVGSLYDRHRPPRNVPYDDENELGTNDPVLPPPMKDWTNDYSSDIDTIEFHWDTDDEFRPRHSDGSFVRIVDPNDPTKVILDREPSSEPGEPSY
jgi:hypothetical protein